jgi:hypothetical protein
MIANQLYYDFVREVERIKTNVTTTNTSVYHDTQVLTKQLTQMKAAMEFRNKEIDRQLNELKKMMLLISQR